MLHQAAILAFFTNLLIDFFVRGYTFLITDSLLYMINRYCYSTSFSYLSLIFCIFLVLKSEVEDLRILLQAADKDVDTLKRARNSDAIESGRRYAALESKVEPFIDFEDFFSQIAFPREYFHLLRDYIYTTIIISYTLLFIDKI